MTIRMHQTMQEYLDDEIKNVTAPRRQEEYIFFFMFYRLIA